MKTPSNDDSQAEDRQEGRSTVGEVQRDEQHGGAGRRDQPDGASTTKHGERCKNARGHDGKGGHAVRRGDRAGEAWPGSPSRTQPIGMRLSRSNRAPGVR